jgi:DNA-binding response OmpR family regulator
MPKLLIVDDDDALRRLMRIELSDDYEVIDSGKPEEGLALALEHKPDAILVDLRMPKYSGYELCQTFTSFSRTQSVPVIIVSGESGAQTKEHCKQLGAIAYFEKPIDFDGLRNCLAQVIKSNRYVPRSEVRVRLRVPLKLSGVDSDGRAVEELATTDNVSVSGFLCSCVADFPTGTILDVRMNSGVSVYVGKVQVVHADSTAGLRQYGCRFTEKQGKWVLE